MNIIFKLLKNQDDIQKCLDSGAISDLYVPTRMMQNWYYFPASKFSGIAIAYPEDLSFGVIGVCCVLKEKDLWYDIGIFVKEEFRNQGIGSKLLETVSELKPSFSYWQYSNFLCKRLGDKK